MLSTLDLPDIGLLVDPFEDHPIGCQGFYHPTGEYGHNPAEPASFLTVFPCGAAVEMCRSWVQQRQDGPPDARVECTRGCQQTHPANQLRHIPID